MDKKIIEQMSVDARLTENYLATCFERDDRDIGNLLDAEKYSLFAGGKRVRPFLVIEFCKMFGGSVEAALPFAAAVEMIHTYSLIHDDLPCMDDDDLRRGKPTNHKVFGYSTALLAGDALLTRAFGVALGAKEVSEGAKVEAIRALSEYAGEFGMVGGQIIDLFGETERLPLEKLIKLHSMKTGALICLSATLGCLAAGLEVNSPEVHSAVEYAKNIGLAFQIVDDLLDATQSAETLGKSAGGDAERNKTTFMTYFDEAGALEYASRLTSSAVSAIASYENSETLTDLAAFLLERKS